MCLSLAQTLVFALGATVQSNYIKVQICASKNTPSRDVLQIFEAIGAMI